MSRQCSVCLFPREKPDAAQKRVLSSDEEEGDEDRSWVWSDFTGLLQPGISHPEKRGVCFQLCIRLCLHVVSFRSQVRRRPRLYVWEEAESLRLRGRKLERLHQVRGTSSNPVKGPFGLRGLEKNMVH